MSTKFTTAARPHRFRTVMTALFMIVPAAAFAADNGNLGTPQNDCEQSATNDYNTNLKSCETSLAGDQQSINQCKADFAYDYQDAIAACKGAAAAAPGGRRPGRLVPVFDAPLTTQAPLGQSTKKGSGLFLRR